MTRYKIYINSNIKKSEIIFSGISFCDFITYTKEPINNIILLKSEIEGNKFYKNFEIIETEKCVTAIKDKVPAYGDFCFVDYADSNNLNTITEQIISELLFASHMYYPISNPFFQCLHNRFLYLSHDDSFFCKVYFRDMLDFLTLINGKFISLIKNKLEISINNIDEDILKNILSLSESGILLNFEDIVIVNNKIMIKYSKIGKYEDMDIVFNSHKKEDSFLCIGII